MCYEIVYIINITSEVVNCYFCSNLLSHISEDLHAIYAYGATEEATFGQSQWLKLLDHDGLKMLEYANDLKVNIGMIMILQNMF